ncbi:hypothetical protein M011DRAFT_474574 [Sporormia fimetaria CBS 119925]|uniref:EthD domain-containing protein n=1 Tax=Sporormia fimetaria CBS 119925 TaxID=1340428 RepID=A0A6A6VK41_9PLEO|nr:hypothetical protein M011DRAFT_474574 [Sporormia fimetaria CBS 119925]
MSTQSVAIVVAYPSTHPETSEPLQFNMSYYLSHHLPLIERVWAPYGLQSWSINEFQNPCPLTGKTPPYLVQATVYFDTLENFRIALEKAVAETGPDLENFSNVQPVVWVGGEKGTGVVEGVVQ